MHEYSKDHKSIIETILSLPEGYKEIPIEVYDALTGELLTEDYRMCENSSDLNWYPVIYIAVNNERRVIKTGIIRRSV